MTSENVARAERLERQVGRLGLRLARLQARSSRLTWTRVWVFLGGTVTVLLVFLMRGVWPGIATGVVAGGAFGVIVAVHRKLEDAIARHGLWRDMRSEQLARLRLDWEALPPPAAGRPAAEHPFGRDLDLTGPRSVLQRIDRCATADGSRRLHDWLLYPEPDLVAARERQALLRAWVPCHRLRDRLLLEARLAAAEAGQRWSERGEVGEDGRWSVDASLVWLLGAADDVGEGAVADRAAEPESTAGNAGRPVERAWFGRVFNWLLLLSTLAGLNWGLLAADRLFSLATGWWQATWLTYAALLLLAGRLTGDTFGEAMRLEAALRRLRAIFRRLEAFEAEEAPELAVLLAPFHDPAHRPSRELRRTVWVSAAASVRGNPLMWLLLNAVVPWDFFFAWRLERLRGRLARALPAWLDAWHTLEALDSFADLLWLDARWTLPELLAGEGADGPMLNATGLVHPLLAPDEAVANDLRLEGIGEIGIITGSNMSGKSTFLRAVGTAAALAMAGGPVPARRFELSPCRLFAVGRIDDSVTAGISFFYGEVRRLAALLNAVREEDGPPVLFMIDEIFRGTNNRERLLGSTSFLAAMAESRTAGLLATHDLELTALAERFPGLRNLHFRDEVEQGRMVFDYRVHDGPCPTTNALRIMRLAGLPAPPPSTG